MRVSAATIESRWLLSKPEATRGGAESCNQPPPRTHVAGARAGQYPAGPSVH